MVVGDVAALAGESAARWRGVRRVLTAHRLELGRVAAGLYPWAARVGGADLLGREEWQPGAPLSLDDVAVT